MAFLEANCVVSTQFFLFLLRNGTTAKARAGEGVWGRICNKNGLKSILKKF